MGMIEYKNETIQNEMTIYAEREIVIVGVCSRPVAQQELDTIFQL